MDEQRPEDSTDSTDSTDFIDKQDDTSQENVEHAKADKDLSPEDAQEGETAAGADVKGGEKLAKAKEKLEEVGGRTREKISHASDKAREKMGEASQRARENLGHASEKAREKGKHFMEIALDVFGNISKAQWFKEIKPLVWTGIALTFVFVVFMFIQGMNYRWWIMLPVGAAGLYTLGRQWYIATDKSGINATLCLVYLILLLLLMIYRDARMSNSLLQLNKPINEMREMIK